MRSWTTASLVALCVAVFLAALSLVTWRQGEAITVMTDVDALRAEISLITSGNDGLRQRIQYLESRGRIATEAGEKLGMYVPDASEQHTLTMESR